MIVHLKVALVPIGTPVTVEVGEDGVVIDAVPRYSSIILSLKKEYCLPV